MEYFAVKNWENLQQYKDRDPKWIKLHRALLDDYEFDQLTEIAQIHLMKIWLLAAKLGNKIPNDPAWIGKKIGAKSKVDLKQMVTYNFLFPYESVQDCTEMYLEREKRERREEREEDTVSAARKVPYQAIIDLYHKVLPELRQVKMITDARKNSMRGRWQKEIPSLEDYETYFQHVRKSEFLMGQAQPNKDTGRVFAADFDWLLKPANITKIVEGKYHD